MGTPPWFLGVCPLSSSSTKHNRSFTKTKVLFFLKKDANWRVIERWVFVSRFLFWGPVRQFSVFPVRCLSKEELWWILCYEPRRANQVLNVMMKGNGNSSRTEENLKSQKRVKWGVRWDVIEWRRTERNATSYCTSFMSSQHDQSVKRESCKMVEKCSDVMWFRKLHLFHLRTVDGKLGVVSLYEPHERWIWIHEG